MLQSSVWYEKYRPQKIDDVVLPPDIKNKVKSYVLDGGFNMPHLGLFSRTPGTGKSSLANAIIMETQAEAMWVNASLERGIDVIRGKIQDFSSQKSMKNAIKIVVLDEFDRFTGEGQAAFRGFIDQFSDKVRFIFTGNYKENILEALLNRLEVYDFNEFRKEDTVREIFKRLTNILDNENVKYEKSDVVQIIKNDYPSVRKMIGNLRKCTEDGVLKYTKFFDGDNLQKIVHALKNRSFEALKNICYNLNNCDSIFTYFTAHLDEIAKDPESKINIVIVLGKYQYQNNFVRDKNLNVLAMCCEVIPFV